MKLVKIFLFFLSIISGIVIVIWLFNKVGIEKVLTTLTLISWWQFLFIFFLSLINFAILLKKWKIISAPYHYKTSLKKLIVAFLGEQAISFLTPVMYVGGEGLKAVILKDDAEKKSFAQTFSLIILDRIADGCALLIFFILGGIFSFFFGYFLLGIVLTFISLIFIFILLLVFKIPEFFIFLIKSLGFKKVIKDEEKIKEEINVIKNFLILHRKNFNLDLFLSFLALILRSFQIYFIISFLGGKISFFQLYLIKIAIIVSGFIPTPGSIGGFEGAIAFIFSSLSLPLNIALALAIIIRTVQIIFVSFGIFSILPYLTSKIYPSISNRKRENH